MGKKNNKEQEYNRKKHWVDINGNPFPKSKGDEPDVSLTKINAEQEQTDGSPVSKSKDEESSASAVKIDLKQEQEDAPSATSTTVITEHNNVLIPEENHTDAPEGLIPNNDTYGFVTIDTLEPDTIEPNTMAGVTASFSWFGWLGK